MRPPENTSPAEGRSLFQVVVTLAVPEIWLRLRDKLGLGTDININPVVMVTVPKSMAIIAYCSTSADQEWLMFK